MSARSWAAARCSREAAASAHKVRAVEPCDIEGEVGEAVGGKRLEDDSSVVESVDVRTARRREPLETGSPGFSDMACSTALDDLVDRVLGPTNRVELRPRSRGTRWGSRPGLRSGGFARGLFGFVDVAGEQSSPRHDATRLTQRAWVNPISAASRIITSRFWSTSTRSPRQVAARTRLRAAPKRKLPVAEALGDFAQLVGVGGPFVERRRRPDRERAPLQDLPERPVVVDATGDDERLVAERSGSSRGHPRAARSPGSRAASPVPGSRYRSVALSAASRASTRSWSTAPDDSCACRSVVRQCGARQQGRAGEALCKRQPR